jgi:hypothetical protein
MFESLPPHDHWIVIRYPASGYDREQIELLSIYPTEAEAKREAALLDAESGSDGPKHAVQILAYARIQVPRDES